ncbi:MAG: cyclic nucleotide-binding domain-containing protein [Balneolia bacterium]|nr:cyclic nucleotide-binding domain-containing protein [Balneolia bacterium]
MAEASGHSRQPIEILMEHNPVVFRNFSRKDLLDVLAIGKTVDIAPFKEVHIFNKYKLPEAYIILDGLVEVRRRGYTIEQYTTGDFIGEGFLHSQHPPNYELRTAIPSTLIVLRRDEMLRFFRERPEKLFKIFTMNVIEAQHRHIHALYKRITEKPEHTL